MERKPKKRLSATIAERQVEKAVKVFDALCEVFENTLMDDSFCDSADGLWTVDISRAKLKRESIVCEPTYVGLLKAMNEVWQEYSRNKEYVENFAILAKFYPEETTRG